MQLESKDRWILPAAANRSRDATESKERGGESQSRVEVDQREERMGGPFGEAKKRQGRKSGTVVVKE
ncbi:hypothetical protein N7510_003703 [Penicillium lagena]|uniref:uncharacterized protein n=1 Tax=Penicillium lagena TaxID=94218 RepID=UPI00253F72FC|nr:uncharacterized protein N7510_003703 [Penicillium lagena]KAJ5619719.1 hypothetical protein N7510_003703 [Penicillium lagena]